MLYNTDHIYIYIGSIRSEARAKVNYRILRRGICMCVRVMVCVMRTHVHILQSFAAFIIKAN